MSKSVAVIVLGDLGRSPRMRNHVESISKLQHINFVDFIGYVEHLPEFDHPFN